MITETQLKRITPNLSAHKLHLYLPHLNQAMLAHQVDTMLRTAAFIAQLAHESGEFRFMEEIWGPTPAQQRYEPPSTLATRLGNVQPGDGKRFKGRGPIQITGRFNYAKYGELLDVDLVSQPEAAARPELAFATAGLFWASNRLNELADDEQFVLITKRINGGTNGLADRENYYERAKAVLAEGFVADADNRAPTRGSPRTRGVRPPMPPLLRGHEAIIELVGHDSESAQQTPSRSDPYTAPPSPLRAGGPARTTSRPVGRQSAPRR